MPHEAKLEHFTYLKFVTTVAGACRMYDKPRRTIQYAIDTGNIAALKDGGVWLISIPSLVARWGWPLPENLQEK